jgi:hypothetical protein
MRSEFLGWNEKVYKKIEEHMRKLESFSLSCPSPASQSLPITPTPPAATITKKKRGRKELLNEQISIQVNIQPNHCRPAVDPPTPAADSDVTRANNVGNTARVHITTISSARVANGSKNHAKSPKTLTRPHLLLIRSYVLVFSIFQANIFGLEREEEDVLSSCLA